MLGCFPCVPLARNLTLGIALLSYDGTIGIGLLGDAERTRDLPDFAKAIPRSLAELSKAAG